MKYSSFAFVLLAGVAASPAFAQDTSSQVFSEANPKLRRNTIEVRPLESAASVAPGIGAGGGSYEMYLGNNFGLGVGASYANVDLPGKAVSTFKDKTDQPVVSHGYGYEVGATLRYYAYPIGDSAYAGVGTDYSEAHSTWKYGDEEYDTTRFAVTPSFLVGYRWVWNNGFLLRVGAGVGLPSIDSSNVTAQTNGPKAAEGQKKVRDALAQKVLVATDLGLGVMF